MCASQPRSKCLVESLLCPVTRNDKEHSGPFSPTHLNTRRLVTMKRFMMILVVLAGMAVTAATVMATVVTQSTDLFLSTPCPFTGCQCMVAATAADTVTGIATATRTKSQTKPANGQPIAARFFEAPRSPRSHGPQWVLLFRFCSAI